MSAKRSWWLVVDVIDGGKVDLCSTNPGFEIDLYVKSPLRSMTAIWMGLTTVAKEIEAGHVELIGDTDIAEVDAAVAGPQPLRQGEEPRRGLRAPKTVPTQLGRYQIHAAPRVVRLASAVTSTSPSIVAWAARMRSKGSR